MSKKIVIIDYSLGNLFSVKQAFLNSGIDAEITQDKQKIRNAHAIVLPGVGAFAEAMNNLKELDLTEEIKNSVKSGKPFMGICLGLQLLFSKSEEFSDTLGLDLIKGNIRKFKFEDKRIKVPNVGWSMLKETSADNWGNSPLKNIKNNEYMYFVHSFYAVPENNSEILSISKYGNIDFCSSVQKDNIFATQFHPEKSAKEGLKIYDNWINQI